LKTGDFAIEETTDFNLDRV